MADEGNSVLSQNAIDSLFGDIPAGDPVVDPGTSADGVTRTPTVGDMPEGPPAAAAAPAPAPAATPAPAPAQQMPSARPWLQEEPSAAAPPVEAAPAAPATELAMTAAPPAAQPPPQAVPVPAAPALAAPPAAAAPPPAPAVPLAVAPTAAAVAPVAAGISGDDVEAMIAPLQATLAAYEQRFAGIDSALARLTEIESKLSELEKSSGRGVERRDLHPLQGKIMKQMRSVIDNLRATPAYGLRKTFACSGCGEVGNVAVRVKCTSCQRETHVGWFPREAAALHKPQAGRGGRSNARVKPAPNGRRSRRSRPGQGRAPR